MSEALRVDSVITTINESEAEAGHTLRESVEDAISSYFQQLDGHPAGELYKLSLIHISEPTIPSP